MRNLCDNNVMRKQLLQSHWQFLFAVKLNADANALVRHFFYTAKANRCCVRYLNIFCACKINVVLFFGFDRDHIDLIHDPDNLFGLQGLKNGLHTWGINFVRKNNNGRI